jgi:large subunit ribosomal protein L10
MNRTEKIAKTQALEEVLRAAKGIYLADYQGMTVEVLSELRRRCRESHVRIEVAKNTLMRRAARSTGNDDLVPYLVGPTAVATSEEDEISPARILMDFQRQFKLPNLKGGIVGGRAMDEGEAKAVSALPTRDILLGQVCRALQGPLSNLVSVFNAPLRKLAIALDEVAKQKGAA